MRVLFLPMPAVGHVFPMVPLAWALRSAGHEVRFATSGAGLAAERAGLPVSDVQPGLQMGELMRRAMAERPELTRMRERPVQEIGGVAGMFAQVSRYLVEPVLRAARRYRPDLLVYSPVNGAALLAAGVLGLPAVDVGFGLGRTAALPGLLGAELADVFAEHGAALPARRASVDVAPPSLAAPQPGSTPMRYVPYNGGAVEPAWLAVPPERPRVAVSIGTVSPLLGGLATVDRVIEAAAEVDAEFVFALGEVGTGRFGAVPPNVRIEGWVPLGALLDTCTAVVHHGGGGTTLTALDAGVAQLILPDGADRHINASAVAARGAGIEAGAEEVDEALLRRLLGDEKLGLVAGQVRAEMRAMPSPAEVAAGLVHRDAVAH